MTEADVAAAEASASDADDAKEEEENARRRISLSEHLHSEFHATLQSTAVSTEVKVDAARRLTRCAISSSYSSSSCDEGDDGDGHGHGGAGQGKEAVEENGTMVHDHHGMHGDGAAGSYWDLRSSSSSTSSPSSASEKKKLTLVSNNNSDSSNNHNSSKTFLERLDEEQAETTTASASDKEEEHPHPPPPLPPASVHLPRLRWNDHFRKGYALCCWVRPSLDQPQQQGNEEEVHHDHHHHDDNDGHQDNDNDSSGGGKRRRRRILYRFATHPNHDDGRPNGAGVCAVLGPWSAHSNDHGHDNDGGAGGDGVGEGGKGAGEGEPTTTNHNEDMLLSARVSVYALPRRNPPSPPPLMMAYHHHHEEEHNDDDGVEGDGGAPRRRSATTEEVRAGGKDVDDGRMRTQSADGAAAPGATTTTPQQQQPSVHEQNMARFREQQQQQKQKQKRGGKRRKGKYVAASSSGANAHHHADAATPIRALRHAASAPTPPADHSLQVSSILTLPANQWSLLTIDHAFPYLKRPTVRIRVNGVVQLEGELGYPVLSSDSSAVMGDKGGPLGFGLLAGVTGGDHAAAAAAGGAGAVPPQVMPEEPGTMGHCTVLDNVFGGGVELPPSSLRRQRPPSSPPSTSGEEKDDPASGGTTATSKMTSSSSSSRAKCSLHLHSVALYPRAPLPKSILALASEHGPSDDATPGSGLVLPLIPSVPQNRDGVVRADNDGGAGVNGSNSGGGGGRSGGGGSGKGGGAGEDGGGRGVGAPLSVGCLVRSGRDGGGKGGNVEEPWDTTGTDAARELQKLTGKAILAYSASNSIVLGGGRKTHRQRRIAASPSPYATSIGNADGAPKVGIVAPGRPSARANHPRSGGDPTSPTGGVGGGGYGSGGGSRSLVVTGNVRLIHRSFQYLASERRRDPEIRIDPHPMGDGDRGPPPSLPRAIRAADPLSAVLLPFRSALPPPGLIHGLQLSFFRNSFVHLESLLRNGGEFAAALMRLGAAALRMGGATRDMALQEGWIHCLCTLLRRVLLRGHRFGLLLPGGGGNDIISSSPANGGASAEASSSASRQVVAAISGLDKTAAAREEAEGNVDDAKDDAKCVPPYVPPNIVDASLDIIDACCGPPVHHSDASGEEEDPPALKVRRGSDLALTAVFAFALDLDLWGGDVVAAGKVVRAVARRYCGGSGQGLRIRIEDGELTLGTDEEMGGSDYGWLLRSQMGVGYLLDVVRLRFDSGCNTGGSALLDASPHRAIVGPHGPRGIDEAARIALANSIAALLLSMLRFTLSSGTSVARGERDVTALVGMLSDAPLGGVTAHAILTSITGLLVECGALLPLWERDDGPHGGNTTSHHSVGVPTQSWRPDLAMRLGRNLLTSQFHDVVAPMLLSRTVFDGRRTTLASPSSSNALSAVAREGGVSQLPSHDSLATNEDCSDNLASHLIWKHHWRLCLLSFAWLASVSGPEGDVASKTTGSLMLASGQAGSLDRCLLGTRGAMAEALRGLLLPDKISFLRGHGGGIGDSDDDDRIYAESVSNRLSAFVPLVPGLVASLLSTNGNGMDSSKGTDQAKTLAPSSEAVRVLADLFATLGLAFKLLYGKGATGLIPSNSRHGAHSRARAAAKVYIFAAKEYIPSLLRVIAMLDEPVRESRTLLKVEEKSTAMSTRHRPSKLDGDEAQNKQRPRGNSDVDWVNVSSASITDSGGDGSASDGGDMPGEDCASLSYMRHQQLSSSCDIALYTVSMLLLKSMSTGGGEASTASWRIVVSALGHDRAPSAAKAEPKQPDTATSGSEHFVCKDRGDEKFARSVLCHLSALVLSKFARRHNHAPWSVNDASAVARLMDLVEEKELLRFPDEEHRGKEVAQKYSLDQVRLLNSLLEILSCGRDNAGWCQLQLPTPPPPSSDIGGSESGAQNDAEHANSIDSSVESIIDGVEGLTKYIGEALAYDITQPSFHHEPNILPGIPQKSGVGALSQPSKLLLPILQHALRNVLTSSCIVSSDATLITAASHARTPSPRRSYLLQEITKELKSTLTAAIVGLSFPVARDVCLNALACLRRAISSHHNSQDEAAAALCSEVVLVAVEEMRVRYESERRRKDKAFDAYEDDTGGQTSAEDEARIGTDNGQSNGEHPEAVSSRVVEHLILGGDVVPRGERATDSLLDNVHSRETVSSEDNKSVPNRPRHESDDFVVFPHGDAPIHDKTVRELAPEGTAMGWSNYKGFGSGLDKCCTEVLRVDDTESNVGKGNEGQNDQAAESNGEALSSQQKAEVSLSILSQFIDTYETKETEDAVESELVELFDENVSLGSSAANGPMHGRGNASLELSSRSIFFPGGSIASSETAADAMSSFFELSSFQKQHQRQLQDVYLPSRRFGRLAFVDRQCWRYWMEYARDREIHFERCVPDGGRDQQSRLVTVPIAPEFGRFIPSYLDHSRSNSSMSLLATDDNAADISTDITSDIELATRLVEHGSVKIVDIMKKEIDESAGVMEEETTTELDFSSEDDELRGSRPETPVVPTEEEVCEHASLEDGSLAFPTRDEDHGEADHKDADEGDPPSLDEEAKEIGPEIHSEEKTTSQQNHHHHYIASSFSFPPDSGSLNTESLLGGFECYFDNCIHVTPAGTRKGVLLLTETHIILDYEGGDGLFEGEAMALTEISRKKQLEQADEATRSYNKMAGDLDRGSSSMDGSDKEHDRRSLETMQRHHTTTAALRPNAIRFNITELSHVYLRRYRLRDSALELFFIPSAGSVGGGTGLFSGSRSLFLDFGAGVTGNVRRDEAAVSIMRRAPMQTVKQWPDKSGQFLHDELRRLTIGWAQGAISNFDYLLQLNILAGRSYNDLCQYPVFPWVLSNFTSKEVPDLSDPANFRDLSKPMGALNEQRLQEFIERFETFQDPSIPPFMYGSHYSTSAGVVLHFLVRLHPFASLHRQLQGGHFDVADRLFSSVQRTWEMCTGLSAAEVKELTPEWYSDPSFLRNANNFKLGTSQDGEVLGDVILPAWADGSPEKFIDVQRRALESDYATENLPRWIDLIFGRAQQGKAAIAAHNVFFYLTYYGSVDVAAIEDEALRTATELQIAHFGQCPMQLFYRSHVGKLKRRSHRKTLTQMLGLYRVSNTMMANETVDVGETTDGAFISDDSNQVTPTLPFLSAPMSHWVHLGAPPPGPHSPLVLIRLALVDRVFSIDAQGIFHSFRWAWKPDLPRRTSGDDSSDDEENDDGDDIDVSADDLFMDRGVFIAQRDLHSFKSVPRLPYAPPRINGRVHTAAAISKTLFAGRSLLLVLSDGDGSGGLAMQLVDPVKSQIRGECIIPTVHSSQITSISMDPIGTAAGHGGVGGELVVCGAADGTASIWRFISSHYWPVRPRLRMAGHGGRRIFGVAITSALNICATTSEERCCLFDVGNGTLLRIISPPQENCLGFPDETARYRTVFADTPALCLSEKGYAIFVCKSDCSSSDPSAPLRSVVSLQMFTLEGIHVGSKALEPWRGVPHRIMATYDGSGVLVCSGRGITVHLVSATEPLKFIDEWNITEDESLASGNTVDAAFDVDFGPNLNRPVVAAAGCSSGALRLHALRGISAWSEENKKGWSSAAGNALAKPAQKVGKVLGGVAGIGSKFVGFGREIGKEAISVVKEREGGFFFRKKG